MVSPTRTLFSIIFFLFLAGAADAGEWIHVVDAGEHQVEVRITESLGDHSTLRAECIIPASHQRVWELLTDYDNLENVIGVVSESRVEGEEDDRLILYQEGRAGLWFVERGFTVRFYVKEVPMAYIGFEAFEGSFKHFTGTWQVDERDGGTWVAHRVEIEPDFYAPGWAVRRVARKMMTETIDGVVTRCLEDFAPTIAAADDVAPAESTYVYRSASPDGSGKFYMGREISQVMGHSGADWLERDERTREEAPDELVRNLGLERDDVVADIGAGTGYFTFRLSPLVPDGQVLAIDIQQEMLDIISERMVDARAGNVLPVLGEIDDIRLGANSIDLALLVDAYHEFSHPREMMDSIVRALRPGGRVVLVEYRGEDPDVPIKPLHKMTETQARAEMSAVGLRWIETGDFLPRQHVMIFQKPAELID